MKARALPTVDRKVIHKVTTADIARFVIAGMLLGLLLALGIADAYENAAPHLPTPAHAKR